MESKKTERKKADQYLEDWVVRPDQEAYPSALRGYPGMPLELFIRGQLPERGEQLVAVVGARMCSAYGKKEAYRFSYELARAGLGIVSGMARGVDAAAHQGALDAGGKTYAVLGCGLDICYPRECRNLYDKIPLNGGLITEFSYGSQPLAWHFPVRNRIISAMADLILVVEAKENSGSLITVQCGLEQGKDVYAVPGRVDDSLSQGANHLIADGAGIACGPEILLEALGLRASLPIDRGKIKTGLASPRDLVYSCLDLHPKSLQNLTEELDLTKERILEELISLQMEGKVLEVFRNHYVID